MNEIIFIIVGLIPWAMLYWFFKRNKRSNPFITAVMLAYLLPWPVVFIIIFLKHFFPYLPI